MGIRRDLEAWSGRHAAIGAVYAPLERLRDTGYVRGMKGTHQRGDILVSRKSDS